MIQAIRAYIRIVQERDPAARSSWEVVTAYPGLHALAAHRVAHRLWHWRFLLLARLLSQFSRWLTGIEIHPGAQIGKRFFIDHGMGVVIGETAEIGDDCTLYHGVTLGGTTWKKEKRHPTLGNNVVIGAGAKVLGPITVGDNARIGSNSVVVRSVPADATVVGIPGRVVVARDEGKSRMREAMARKIGFDAYGQSPDMPDPVAHAIDCMLDHMQVVDERMELMCQAMKHAGFDVTPPELPELDIPHLENDDDKKGNLS
ncbi:MAG: serine O-acetyltransferase [Gammaproteobacteria bacterium]|nr:MAG: serine O-acetyltransferase [Gammaproteobacteria bacterium]